MCTVSYSNYSKAIIINEYDSQYDIMLKIHFSTGNAIDSLHVSGKWDNDIKNNS